MKTLPPLPSSARCWWRRGSAPRVGRGGRKPAPVQTELGTADLAAVKLEDAEFEQIGEISDSGLIVVLDSISKFERVRHVGAGAKEQADLRRQAQLRGARPAGAARPDRTD